jgi:hypothetical protein
MSDASEASMFQNIARMKAVTSTRGGGRVEAVHFNEGVVGVFGVVEPLGGSILTGDDWIAWL